MGHLLFLQPAAGPSRIECANQRYRALVAGDRFYPSWEACSRCGMVKAELSLTERIY
jgi:hypothetical protein